MGPLRLARVAGLTLLAAALSASIPAGAAWGAGLAPGPPTDVHATGIVGGHGLTVTWSAPASDGGAPILYYVASDYSGKHRCIAVTSGSGTCHIDGVTVGELRPTIRVRAVNENGRGVAAPTLPSVLHAGEGSTSTPSAAGPSGATPGGPAPTSPSAGAGEPSGTSTDSSARSLQLPFTGADVELLVIAGLLSLVVGGLLLVERSGRSPSPSAGACAWLHPQ